MSFLNSIFKNNNQDFYTVDFLEIKKQGRVFWCIDSNCAKPTFLATYPRLTFKSKIFSLLITIIWQLKLQRFFFNKKKYDIDKGSVYDILSEHFPHLSFFTGTPGVNRKIIIVGNKSNHNVFFKIATSKESELLVRNEIEILKKLKNYDFGSHKIPSIAKYSDLYGITDVAMQKGGGREVALKAVNSFYEILYTQSADKVDLSNILQEMRTSIDSHPNFKKQNDRLVYDLELNIKLQKRVLLLLSKKDIDIDVYFSHGDLTLWNVFPSPEDSLAVIDWELGEIRSKYFDLIHFIVSQEILIKNSDFDTVYTEVFTCLQRHTVGETKQSLKLYVCLYFLQQSNYYSLRYKQQTGFIHEQVYWQLDIWNSYFEFFLGDFSVNKHHDIIEKVVR
ncbi:phosphotransferase family protein [Pseudoalteromonas sp. SR45-4]|uniref:phosphotransferase family protein n=1 Tax=Pseudoalteromonas sp. SR45-4 TaxID=2760929 RepID=UPI0015F9DED3|nr:hypothetical protein [Pseudoalteromonas sp. SR45-4]MBB1372605.1 hypothetical protein [Pseudoalteromonas sp. SR45-4]